jgi:hypothetical protein
VSALSRAAWYRVAAQWINVGPDGGRGRRVLPAASFWPMDTVTIEQPADDQVGTWVVLRSRASDRPRQRSPHRTTMTMRRDACARCPQSVHRCVHSPDMHPEFDQR